MSRESKNLVFVSVVDEVFCLCFDRIVVGGHNPLADLLAVHAFITIFVAMLQKLLLLLLTPVVQWSFWIERPAVGLGQIN